MARSNSGKAFVLQPNQPRRATKRGAAMKPERRVSPQQYAAMLRRMVAQAIDPAMKAYSRNYGKIIGLIGLAQTADRMFVLDDGSRISDHLKQHANGVVRTGLAHVRRTIEYKGSTETAAGADSIELPSNASLWRSQRGLPVGSTIKEHCRIGRPSIPRGRGFNPVKVTTYKSDQRATQAFGHRLYKAPAFKANATGLNEIYSKLIAIEPSEINMRRLSLMQQPTWAASHDVTDTHIEEFWNSPSNTDMESPSSTKGSRSSYFPFDLGACLRYVNLNEVLTSKIRVSILQCKGPNTGAGANSSATYYPDKQLEQSLASMPLQSQVSATGGASAITAKLANAYDGEAGAVGGQNCWGYTTGEFATKVGSWDFKVRKSIKSSPRYRENFNEIYSTGYVNVGAGSAYEFKLDHHINRNFEQLGQRNAIDQENVWTAPALFLLVETKGRSGTEYYKATKDVAGAISRTFSSGTGPVSFGWEFETDLSFTTEDQPIKQSVEDNITGLPYKKSYLNIDNEINVSEIINQPFDQIVASETEIPAPVAPATEVNRIIVPVIKSTNIQGSQIRGIKT